MSILDSSLEILFIFSFLSSLSFEKRSLKAKTKIGKTAVFLLFCTGNVFYFMSICVVVAQAALPVPRPCDRSATPFLQHLSEGTS